MTKLQNFKNHIIWRQKCYKTHRSLSKHLTSKAQPQNCCNYCWTGSACNSKADIRSSWLNTSGLRLFASSQTEIKNRKWPERMPEGPTVESKGFLQFVFERHKLNGPHGPQKIWERSWQISFQSDACNGHTALFTSAGDCKQESEENGKERLSQDEENEGKVQKQWQMIRTGRTRLF